jgi:hypothetical protein
MRGAFATRPLETVRLREQGLGANLEKGAEDFIGFSKKRGGVGDENFWPVPSCSYGPLAHTLPVTSERPMTILNPAFLRSQRSCRRLRLGIWMMPMSKRK